QGRADHRRHQPQRPHRGAAAYHGVAPDRAAAMRERGFALIAVLLVLAFMAIIGAEFAFSMRLEATAARMYKENLIAAHLAEAGFEQALREIAADYAWVTLGDRKEQEEEPECPFVFFGRDRVSLKRLPHKNVPFG